MRCSLLIQSVLIACVYAAPPEPASNRAIETSTDYFMKYTPDFFATVVQPAAVASGDENPSNPSLVDNPIFRDHVVTFQTMANIEPTGTINQETLEKMEESRCGVQDTNFDPNAPGKYEVQSSWLTKRDRSSGLYTVTYSFPKKTTPRDLKFQSFKKGVTLAMCTWELISNFRFKNLGLGKNHADVLITYEKGNHGDGYSFDGRGGTLGHAFYPEDGRLHLDLEEKWYFAKPEKEDRVKKDIYTVALHELGHTLGLLHSKESEAVMAPFYRFRGTFENLRMPDDEIQGVAQMYGKRIDSNPADEDFSACREVKRKYRLDITPPDISAKKTVVLEEFEEEVCEDDPLHATTHCPAWKARGFCEEKIFARTLHKRCPFTCGFCSAAEPASRKPDKVETAAGLASSICDIKKFDSMITTYDQRDGFAALLFKDDYYFKTEISLLPAKYDTHTLFNTTEEIKGAYKMDTDPKTINPGLFKIKTPNFMDKTDSSHASVLTGKRYLIFQDDKVHVYGTENSVLAHLTTQDTAKLFPGYPNFKVDAAHAKVNEEEDSVTYTLFHKSHMWQYKEYRDSGSDNLLFVPMSEDSGSDIEEWNGVPACDIDAVFEYRGVPYFLKGNIFWPAVDTEPQIPRDITYNLFRCWKQEPEDLSIPTTCNTEKDNNSGNHAASIQFNSNLLVSLLTLVNYVIFKIIF